MKRNILYITVIFAISLLGAIINNSRQDEYGKLKWIGSPEVWEKPQ